MHSSNPTVIFAFEKRKFFHNQGIVVRAVQHGLRDDHDEHAVPHAAVIHQDHRTQDKHDGDRNAQREEAEQADQKDDKFHVLSPIPFWARC